MAREHEKLSGESAPATEITMNFDPHQICFGLNRELDERSFSLFLQLAGNEELTKVLASRLSSENMDRIVTEFTSLMKQYLTEDEYHRLFLREESPHKR